MKQKNIKVMLCGIAMILLGNTYWIIDVKHMIGAILSALCYLLPLVGICCVLIGMFLIPNDERGSSVFSMKKPPGI